METWKHVHGNMETWKHRNIKKWKKTFDMFIQTFQMFAQTLPMYI